MAVMHNCFSFSIQSKFEGEGPTVTMDIVEVRGYPIFDVVYPLDTFNVNGGCVCLLDCLLKSFRENQKKILVRFQIAMTRFLG